MPNLPVSLQLIVVAFLLHYDGVTTETTGNNHTSESRLRTNSGMQH